MNSIRRGLWPSRRKRSNSSRNSRLRIAQTEGIGTINAPKAQLERAVTVHRLDTDTDEAWEAVMELIAEEDGVELIFNDDGSVTLRWALRNEGEHQAICPEVEPVEEGAEEDETPF